MIRPQTLAEALDLIADLQAEHPFETIRRIAAWAEARPAEIAELVVTLGAMAGGRESVGRLANAAGFSPEAISMATKECHRLHAQGRRDDWVNRGERLYQRDKKRRYRSSNPAPHRPVEGAA